MDVLKPLWMPEGSVRAIIAMALVGGMIFLPESDAIKSAAMVVLGFYFGSRNKEDENG